MAARKHIFTEKPVCVDAAARMCLAAYTEANRHQLSIVAGTQRAIRPVTSNRCGASTAASSGAITSMRVYWNGGTLWSSPAPSR